MSWQHLLALSGLYWCHSMMRWENHYVLHFVFILNCLQESEWKVVVSSFKVLLDGLAQLSVERYCCASWQTRGCVTQVWAIQSSVVFELALPVIKLSVAAEGFSLPFWHPYNLDHVTTNESVQFRLVIFIFNMASCCQLLCVVFLLLNRLVTKYSPCFPSCLTVVLFSFPLIVHYLLFSHTCLSLINTLFSLTCFIFSMTLVFLLESWNFCWMFRDTGWPWAARLKCLPGWTEADHYEQSRLWPVFQVPFMRATPVMLERDWC